jgi:xanthomonalisin
LTVVLTGMLVFALFDNAAAMNSVSTAATKMTRVLAQHVPAAVANGRAQRLHAMAAKKHLSLALNLPLRNQAQLDQLLQDLQDPKSPNFHHYLTREQFTDYFEPTQADYDAVIAWAKANGLSVTSTVPNRRFVLVDGSVATINRTLHIALGEYQHPSEDRVFFATDSEPTTAGLSVALLQIGGLNNYTLPHPKLKHVNAPMPNLTGSGPSGEYLPSDMRAAYYGSGSLTGTGQTIGILSFDGYQVSDLMYFYSQTGTSMTVPVNNVLVNGYSGKCVAFTSTGTVNSATCDDGEQILDIVNAIGMAPGASQILFYEGDPSSSTSDNTMLNQMAVDNIAKTIGCSWGWDPTNASADDAIFQRMAAQGQSFFNATGDNGAFSGTINYEYPSVSKYIIQVGGTDLTTTGPGGAWVSETGWTDSSGGFESGTTIPSWQQLPGVINANNKGSTTLRNSPDVAMEANFDNPTVSNGQFLTGYGGTSYAAPRWAGFAALINQQSLANGNSTIGFFNPALYNLGVSANYTSTMHDITSGTNQGTDPSNKNKNIPGAIFSAVTGYDLVTGWGSPTSAFITALAGTPAAGSLTINKTVSRALPTAATFNFTIACTNPSNPTPIAVANQSPSIAMAANTTTGSVTVSPIALGSTCSVSETAPTAIANYTWGATPTRVTGISVASNTTASAAFTNTLTANPGSLSVTKTISGVASSVISNALTFPFSVSCATPTATYSGSVTVAIHTLSGTSAPISVPAGTTSCTVSEGTRPTAPSNYVWGTASFAQPPATALAAGGSLSAAITNPLGPIPFTVSATAGANGSVSPVSQVVNSGTGATVTITPNTGYRIGSVTGTCSGSLSGSVYTIPTVSANCTVVAAFSAITYAVTATAGPHGTLSPGTQVVSYGVTASVTATPAAGYTATVTGDTCSTTYAGNNVWTTSALHANCNLTAGFTPIAPGFVSLVPARVLDTRTGFATVDGLFAGIGAVTAGGEIDLSVLARGGVAANGVTAVVLNVTATNPTVAGYVTVWPTGSALPNASNLNILPAQTIANLVVVKLGSNGKVSLYNALGSTDLIADVVGYFTTGSDLNSLVPARLLDTRANAPTADGQFAGSGPVPTYGRLDLTIDNRVGIPASGVSAVILNVTATNPTAPGYITVWPSDQAQPLASNLNFVAGQTIPNLVISAVSAQGQVALFNSAGSTDLIADVMGWFPSPSELTAVTPARLLDTRPGTSTIDGQSVGGGPLATYEIRGLTVTGRGNIPATGVGAVVLNVTATNPTANAYLTVWPAGAAQPNASNLNFVPNQTIANLVIAKVGTNGQVSLFNSAGTTDVVVDVVGWFPSYQ